jgi:hypothetical protein
MSPFNVARLFATMDLMLKGRAAWNIVTSLNRAEAANFGRDEHMGHDARYDRADEFMEVVLGHWNTWEDDALILDKANNRFADPAKVHRLDPTAEKAERLKALGASDVINYTETPDWDEKARELTDGRGVDCVVEIGGPGTIAMSLKALAMGGHVSLIGASLSLSRTGLDPLLLTARGNTLGSISVGSRTDVETMNRAIALAKEGYRHAGTLGRS